MVCGVASGHENNPQRTGAKKAAGGEQGTQMAPQTTSPSKKMGGRAWPFSKKDGATGGNDKKTYQVQRKNFFLND